MKKNLFVALAAIALAAACGSRNDLPAPPPEPPTGDTTKTDTVPPLDSSRVALYITFAEAEHDTVNIQATDPKLAFAVHASQGLASVAVYAMRADGAKKLADITTFSNDTLYEHVVTSADINFADPTLQAIRVQAIDRKQKSVRATVAVRLRMEPVITFSSDTLRVNINPIVEKPVPAYTITSVGLRTVAIALLFADGSEQPFGEAISTVEARYEGTLPGVPYALTLVGIRITATDANGNVGVATLPVVCYEDNSVPPQITFLQPEARVYGNVNPIVRLRVVTPAGLKQLTYKHYPSPDDIPNDISTVTSFTDNTDFTGEVAGLLPAHFARNGAMIEVVAEDVNGKRASQKVEVKRLPAIDDAELLAFPGAEGFARAVTGGRGGRIIHVTNLDDAGPGSFRAAVDATVARIIVFDVSGTINLKSRIQIRDGRGDVTIAGQTAPGDGICVAQDQMVVDADNVIIRYIRCRLGVPDPQNIVESDALWGRYHTDVLIDHCSMSWSVDECASFYEMKNLTIQWCLLAESLANSGHAKGSHGYGCIWGGHNATFHHNMLAHHNSRNPRFASGGESQNPNIGKCSPVDYRNNVVYNWGTTNSAYAGEGTDINFVGNYYKYGPATKSSIRNRLYAPSPREVTESGVATKVWGKLFVEGNYVYGDGAATADNWRYGIQGVTDAEKALLRVSAPNAYAPVTEHTAEVAFDRVTQLAGCSLVRDAVDTRVAREAVTGTYTYRGSNGSTGGIIDNQNDVGGWPVLNSLAAPKDSDGDGMPDAWETANGLNPNSAADAGTTGLSARYTNVEMYLAWIVQHITAAQQKN